MRRAKRGWRSRPHQPTTVPVTLDAASLRSAAPEVFAGLVAVSAERIGERGQTYRYACDYGPNDVSGPATFVAKFPSPYPEFQAFKQSLGLPTIERNVHLCVSGTASFRVPALVAEVEGPSPVLLLEDLGSVSLDLPDDAVMAAEALASFHAAHWTRVTPWAGWLPTEIDGTRGSFLLDTFSTRGAAAVRQAPWVPAELKKQVPALATRYEELLHRLASSPRTVVHGDLHAGNVLRLADGGVGAVDWEAATAGRGATDLAYLLMSAGSPDARRRVEDDVLVHYAKGLADAGVAYDINSVVEDYRLAIAAYFCRRVALRVAFSQPIPRDQSMVAAVNAMLDHGLGES